MMAARLDGYGGHGARHMRRRLRGHRLPAARALRTELSHLADDKPTPVGDALCVTCGASWRHDLMQTVAACHPRASCFWVYA
jgi:hypothetical protein